MPPVKKPPHQREPHFLKEWRNYRKINQEDAAEFAIMSRSVLSKVENGKVGYQQDMMERLAKAYGCTVGDLVSRNPFAQPRIPIFDLPKDDAERVYAFIRALSIARTADDAEAPQMPDALSLAPAKKRRSKKQ